MTDVISFEQRQRKMAKHFSRVLNHDVFAQTKLNENDDDACYVQVLQYNDCNIVKIPNTIGHFTILVRLAFCFNNISEIPIEIGTLSRLKFLDLSFNKIKRIPETIGNLKNLEELNLADNQIEDVPQEIENLENIRYLCLSRNKFETISRSLINLAKKIKTRIVLPRNRLIYLPIDLLFVQTGTTINISKNTSLIMPKYSELKTIYSHVLVDQNISVLKQMPSWKNFQVIFNGYKECKETIGKIPVELACEIYFTLFYYLIKQK